jgi:BolA family transcriptional regulator, general stress-responsive regulator
MVAGFAADKAAIAKDEAMSVVDRITRTLTEAFRPAELKVVDESHLHKGHAGHRPSGESHFRVKIAAAAFQGKSRVEAHRMVNAALAEEFAGGLHALAIEAKAAPAGLQPDMTKARE